MTTKGFEITQSETIIYEKGDGIAWITLNRPERMNALGRELGQARGRALKDAAEDDSILAIIFTGAGGRSFSAGADLKEGAEQYYSGTRPDQQPAPEFRFDENDCGKVMIAAIDGYALGGGLELSLRCDIRIATEASSLGPARGTQGPHIRDRRAHAQPDDSPWRGQMDPVHRRPHDRPARLRHRSHPGHCPGSRRSHGARRYVLPSSSSWALPCP